MPSRTPRTFVATVLAFALTSTLGISDPVEAAKNKWSSQGPFGGSVTAEVVDPSTPTTIYVGVDGEGVFRSTDGGQNWAAVNGTAPDDVDPRVQALAFDNQIPPNLYAATNGGGVYRTTDGGTTWEEANGSGGGALVNLSVLSLVIHPNIEDLDGFDAIAGNALLFAGTNGGGVFRGQFDTITGDVVWEEENFGLGNRVIFDLEIPEPQQLDVVINEVDARNAGETGEFIELFGPKNLLLGGLTLVLYDGAAAESGDCLAMNLAYDAFDLDGFSLDNNGFFVLGDPGVPGVDFAPGGFDLLNTSGGVDSAAVALYLGEPGDFVGEDATEDDLLDALVYQTGGGSNDECFLMALGFGAEDEHVSEAGFGGADVSSIARISDGGIPSDLDRFFATQDITPDDRNVPLKELYAATDLEGVYLTADLRGEPDPGDGIFWAPLNNGLDSDVVFTLAVDPVDPNPQCALSTYTIYAGTSGQGVFRSTDPCNLDVEEDWQPVSGGLPANTTVTAMDVAPTVDPQQVLSALYLGTELGDVYKSTDGGGSWQLRSNGLGGLRVDSLEIDPTLTNCGSEGFLRPCRVYAGTLGAGVYKTIDGASNWFLTSADLAGLIGVFVQDVAVNPVVADADNLVAATFGGGIFKSDNAGQSWVGGFNTGLGSLFVNTVALDPTDALMTFYAGTDVAGAFKTTDGGGTWAATPVADGGPAETSILEMAIDPSDAMTVYAVTGKLFRSVDGGASWAELSDPAMDPDLFGESSVQTVAVDPATPLTVYAGTQDRGLFKTTDGGVNWSRIGQNGLTESFIRAIAVDPDSPMTVYAGTDGGGVFKSNDGGTVWVPRNNGLPEGLIVLSITIDAEDPSIVYVGTEGDDAETGGVYKTIDGGANWSPYNTSLTNFVIKDVEIAPRADPELDSQFLHAASFGGGVFDYEKEELFLIDPMTGLITSEAGGTDSFSVRLARIPTANVTLELESTDPGEGTVDPTVLLFTPGNALDDQFVTVTGVSDGELDGDQDYAIQLKPAISQDTDFAGVDPDDVSVTNLDVFFPPPGVTVDPTGGLETTEDGGTATFTVVLRSVPTADVTISLESTDPGEGTASPSSLVFNASNFDTPQTVTVTGVQDGVADGDQTYVIATTASSADGDYDGIAVPDVTLMNLDNGLTSLFETADLGATGQSADSGITISSNVFLGAKLTVTETVTIRTLGGHLVADGADGSIFVAIVPLVGADELPPDVTLGDDAELGTAFTAPSTSAEVAIPVDFVLEPGRYGMVFGAGQFGSSPTGRAKMPANDSDVGSPEYFFSDNSVPAYFDGGFSNARFFINGFAGIDDVIFADGFESGDTTAWSATIQ